MCVVDIVSTLGLHTEESCPRLKTYMGFFLACNRQLQSFYLAGHTRKSWSPHFRLGTQPMRYNL